MRENKEGSYVGGFFSGRVHGEDDEVDVEVEFEFGAEFVFISHASRDEFAPLVEKYVSSALVVCLVSG